MTRLSRATLGKLPESIAGPGHDPAAVRPGIVHIGLGGFHRAHMARYLHDLMALDADALGWGIVGAGLRVTDRPLLAALAAQDGLFTLIEREGEEQTATVIASSAGVIDASVDTTALLATMASPATRIVSLTVTEHGYRLDRATKRLDLADPAIRADLAQPTAARTPVGLLVEAHARRRAAGTGVFTTLCCDNIQHNGNVLRAALLAFAEARDPALAGWIAEHGRFPNAMVDRITPFPDPAEVDALAARTGLDDHAVLVAEPFRQWVIEDRFAVGRPALERVGVQFVADVTPYEHMKLRLLNASHLAIAGLGQLAGHARIDETLRVPAIARYMTALTDHETGEDLPAVPGVDLAAYKRTLVARFANPAIRDTTQRVNSDAPLNYLLDPIRDRLAAGKPIPRLALAVAAWVRRMRGADEAGRPIAVVHPLAEELRAAALAGGSDPRPVLAIAALFGDLAGDERFVAPVADWSGLLDARGVAGALDEAGVRGLI